MDKTVSKNFFNEIDKRPLREIKKKKNTQTSGLGDKKISNYFLTSQLASDSLNPNLFEKIKEFENILKKTSTPTKKLQLSNLIYYKNQEQNEIFSYSQDEIESSFFSNRSITNQLYPDLKDEFEKLTSIEKSYISKLELDTTQQKSFNFLR